MSLQSAREMLAIQELIDSRLRVTSCSSARDGGGLYPEGPYSFEADVRPYWDTPEEAEAAKNATAHETRTWLIRRAQDAIDALDAAGWRLTSYPHMEIAGGVTRLPGQASIQGGIVVTVRFAVDRDRSDEEMAMHPDVVAARILGF